MARSTLFFALLFLTLGLCSLAGQTQTDNQQRDDVLLQLEQGMVTSGDQITLDLNMVNADDVAGLQFTVRDTLGLLNIIDLQPGIRLDGYNMQYNHLDDGSVIVIAFNIAGGVIPPGEGPIVQITFEANPVFSQSLSGLSFSHVYIGDALAQEMPFIIADCFVVVNPADASQFIIDDASLLLNVENSVPIYLSNDVPVSGFQFHLTFLPELAHAVSITGTERTAGWMISYGFNNVIGFNFSGVAIAPGDGPIAVLQVQGDTEGEFSLCISDIILSDPEGLQLPAASQCSDMAVIQSGALGDLNQDDAINVIDVVQLVNIILNGDATPYQQWAGDINNDDIINILDVVQLVAIILDGRLTKGENLQSAKLITGNGILRYESEGTTAGLQLFTSGDFEITENLLPEGWQMAHQEDIILIYTLTGAVLEDAELFKYSGVLEISDNVAADWNGNSLTAEVDSDLPNGYLVGYAYPNPFNPVTNLEYSLSKEASVQIDVFNMLGEKVANLEESTHPAGTYHISWQAGDQSSGIYLVNFALGPLHETRKVILLK